MQLLSLNFVIYTISGLWRPIEWSSNVVKLLYNVYTFIVILSEYFVTLTQFMDIILIVDNIDDFAINTLLFLTILVVCCKATVIVVRRKAIITLMQILIKKPFKPRDEKETAIQTKFDMFIRSCLIKYIIMTTSSTSGGIILFIFNMMQGRLPTRIWLPFNYNTSLVFHVISIHQIITVIFASLINVGTDTLVFGLFLHTCAQFEIFESRLYKLIINKTSQGFSSSKKDEMEISECIRHHLSIYKFAKMINVVFNQVLFIQFFGSILVLCTSVYYLITHILEPTGISLLAYIIAMFLQIYIYCWSGNEVILKSTSVGDAIYSMDWPLLPIKEQKELFLIMLRSTIPIKFTSSFLITVSLQSYCNILKMSYSAFNILQK